MKMLQDMQARSIGWNYKDGRPFGGEENDASEEIPTLRIRVMTEEEEAEIREQGEKELEGIMN